MDLNKKNIGTFKCIAVLLILALVYPTLLIAQPKNFSLKGIAAVKDGDKYPYQLTLSLSRSTVSGYSVTKQPDGTELKAKIKGHINRKLQLFTFSETESIGTIPSSFDVTCLFDAQLFYKLKDGKFFVSGIFSGKDNKGNQCGAGIMTFEQIDDPSSIFHTAPLPPKVAKVPPSVKEDNNNGPATDSNVITAGSDKRIQWHSDKCILEVWDGGVVDGDIITVSVDNKTVLTDYSLVKEKKQIPIPFPGHTMTITITAGDEGSAPPNTAQIILRDGNEEHKITAFNKKGDAASVQLIKK